MGSERLVTIRRVTDLRRIAWAAGLGDADAERYLDVPWEESDPDVLAIRGNSQSAAYRSGRLVAFRAAFGGKRHRLGLYDALWPNQRAWLTGLRAGEWLAHNYPIPPEGPCPT
jgi:hypothetical protein